MHKQFSVSNIKSKDLKARSEVSGFLNEPTIDGIRARPEQELQRAFETGQCLTIREGGNLVGCAMLFHYEEGINHSALYSEIGAMRVSANGYGLQELITPMLITQILLQDYQHPDHSIFAVVQPGTASEYILQKKSLFSVWSPPPLLLYLRNESGVPFSENKQVLCADAHAKRQASKKLSNHHIEENRFKTPKGDGEVCLELGWFLPEHIKEPLT